MKHHSTTLLTIIITAATLATASHVLAQPHALRKTAEAPRRNAVHIDPAGIAFGAFGVAYERVLTPHLSLQVGAEYINPWDNDEVWALSSELRVSLYPFGRAPGGLYLSPLMRGGVVFGQSQTTADTANAFLWAGGGVVGWAWLWGPVDIRLGAGALYYDLEVDISNGTTTETVGVSGFTPTAELTFGIVF
ncbi:MAG: hypothetical protein JRH20_14690 [Deltaproteobacteria bacterium]|nr:hypothetical protein [Deltaproteobacteria bacterium]